jgi:hypothetical protein
MSNTKAAICRPGLNRTRQITYHRIRKGAGRSGPCNPGGVSPSLHHDHACVTGPIFTGPGQSTPAQSQNGFFEPNCAGVDAPASSGSIQFLEKTAAWRRTPHGSSSRRSAISAASAASAGCFSRALRRKGSSVSSISCIPREREVSSRPRGRHGRPAFRCSPISSRRGALRVPTGMIRFRVVSS